MDPSSLHAEQDGVVHQDAVFGEDRGDIIERGRIVVQDQNIVGRDVAIDQQDSTNIQSPVEQDVIFVRWLEMHLSLVGGPNWDVRAEVNYTALNSRLKTNIEVRVRSRQPSKFGGRYDVYIWEYVNNCPFHLFDTRRQRNVTRCELKDDISTAFRSWLEAPLSCDHILDILLDSERQLSQNSDHSEWEKQASHDDLEESKEYLRPYLYAAMIKHPLAEGQTPFISAVIDALRIFNLAQFPPARRQRGRHGRSRFRRYSIKHLVLHELITRKRAQTALPAIQDVQEQIALFGQYAILSHRWCQDGQELSFADVLVGLSDPIVQSKEGYRKLMGFSTAVTSLYGCRYVWMDSVCICEDDRNASIPRMFGWYRQAYVCLIYFATSPKVVEDPWSTRGWTLQELLAPNQFRCFKSDWAPVVRTQRMFHANRGVGSVDDVHKKLESVAGHIRWLKYKPGIDQVFQLFQAMRNRETTMPEDMVYSLLSALDSKIPVMYGEGFDSAFYRLQVECLSRGGERALLMWGLGLSASTGSSPCHSMLAADFKAFVDMDVYTHLTMLDLSDPSISFDVHGVMRIMATLHWPPSSRLARIFTFPLDYIKGTMFAVLGRDGEHNVYGVLLRPVPLTSPFNTLPSTIPEGEAISGGQQQVSSGKRIVYERIKFLKCNLFDLTPSYLSKMPEWVYIK